MAFRNGTWRDAAISATVWAVGAASLIIFAFGTTTIFNLALWLCVLGALGWGITFFVVWDRQTRVLPAYYALAPIIAWCLTALILHGSWLDQYTGRDYGVRLSNLFALMGTMGGLAFGLVLKKTISSIGWAQVALSGLAWGVAIRIFPLIYLVAPDLQLFMLPVAGFISGGLGTSFTIWQINLLQGHAPQPTPKINEDGEFASDWYDGLAKPKRKSKLNAPTLKTYLRMGALAAAIAVIVAGVVVVIAPPRQVTVYVTGIPGPAIWDVNLPTPTAYFNGYFRDQNYTLMLVNDIPAHICQDTQRDTPKILSAGTSVIVQNASFSLTSSTYTYYVTSLDRSLCGEALTSQLMDSAVTSPHP